MLFRCASCNELPSFAAFPICKDCESHLVRAPSLCPGCGGLHCTPLRCERPWRGEPDQNEIASYTALYLSVEPGYSVLKRWKVAGGPLFDRRVLVSKSFEKPPESAHAIVPIPQRPSRFWRLQRSPAETIAQWLAGELRLPMIRILEGPLNAQQGKNQKRQAELSLDQRIQSRLRFKARPSAGITQVILVDDFMTSGRTFRAGAQALREVGIERVHAFALAIRPQRME